jgi:hypothetical protein
MRTIALAAVLALSLPAAALAEGQATAQPASLAQPAPQKPKLICRFRTHEGMVIGKPVCATREQWELAIYKAQHEVADFQERAYSR